MFIIVRIGKAPGDEVGLAYTHELHAELPNCTSFSPIYRRLSVCLWNIITDYGKEPDDDGLLARLAVRKTI